MPPCRRAQGQKNIILQVQRDGRGLPAAVLLHHGDGAGHLRGGGAVRSGQQGGRKVVAVFCPGALFQGEVSGHQLVAGLPCQRGDAGGQAVRHDLVKAVGCHGIAQLRLKKGVQPISIYRNKPRFTAGGRGGGIHRLLHGRGAGEQLLHHELRLFFGGVAAQTGQGKHGGNSREEKDKAQCLLAKTFRLHTQLPSGRALLALLVFQFLLFCDVGFHLGLCPAVQIGLALPGDAQRLRGHILGNGASCGGVGTIAHLDRSHKVGVTADEAVIADLGAELILAVIVAGDGAAAEVAVFAHIAVADVGQVAHGVAPGKVGVLGLHIGAQMHAIVGDGVHPHMGEGADVVVGADVAAVDLAGIHGSALVHGAVLDEGVGADDAACADDRLAPQDGARKDHSTRSNDHLRVDLHGAAVNDHAVCNVLHKDVLAGSLGGVQLCQSCGAGLFRNGILHEKISLPTKARGGRETGKATGKLLPVRPASPLRKALFRQNKNEKVTGIESCIQQDEKSRV